MTTADQIKQDLIRQDLDFVANAVRRHDRDAGVPAIHFLWAAIVLIGFALPDFAPRMAGAFWFVAGIAGGLLSWWLGARDARRTGFNDGERGKRYGLHWLVAGVGFVLCGLPMMFGQVEPATGASSFMLVAGLVYALAGVHLVRPLLWIGLLMLAAYAAMIIAAPPYTWTISGIVIAIGLVSAGIAALGLRKTDAMQ